MRMRTRILAVASGAMIRANTAAAGEARTRGFVRHENVAIDLIAEGGGPLIVLLPSRGRDSEDYEEVSSGLAKAGFRVLAAAAAKKYPAELSALVSKAGDPSLPDAERLKIMQQIFFAPGHDPSVWLNGWHPEANESQLLASRATAQAQWWSAGTVPLLDLQAAHDPFRPRETANELKDEFGDRVTIAVIPDASHALIPEEPAAVT